MKRPENALTSHQAGPSMSRERRLCRPARHEGGFMDFDRARTIVHGARGQWLALALLAALPAVAAGQATTGTVRGTVRDQQGAVVPGTTVTVRNTDTNIARTAVTGDHGEYLVTN